MTGDAAVTDSQSLSHQSKRTTWSEDHLVEWLDSEFGLQRCLSAVHHVDKSTRKHVGIRRIEQYLLASLFGVRENMQVPWANLVCAVDEEPVCVKKGILRKNVSVVTMMNRAIVWSFLVFASGIAVAAISAFLSHYYVERLSSSSSEIPGKCHILKDRLNDRHCTGR